MNRVQYIDVANLRVGFSADVKCFDHPSAMVRNGHWATTSVVESITPGNMGPTFQTKNTEYRPCDRSDPMPAAFVHDKPVWLPPTVSTELRV